MSPSLPLDDLAALAALLGRAEAAGGLGPGAVHEADALIERLRGAWTALGAEERPILARAARGLVDRRGALPATDAETADPADPPLAEVLERLGAADLRPGQDRAIAAALGGQDALVVMATGSGKSLCYQAPALCRPGLTLVISPLIALMEDQAARLRAAGLPVGVLTSQAGEEESRATLADLRAGRAPVGALRAGALPPLGLPGRPRRQPGRAAGRRRGALRVRVGAQLPAGLPPPGGVAGRRRRPRHHGAHRHGHAGGPGRRRAPPRACATRSGW